ncbi:hypothetical protein [Variovorax atrisoli]|uniref:hypothetical protein n=1 Tax=Variovorax atrisoli TaxID=3394203 RepID=UPI00119AD470|nr:hypothetical protein [Variovorax paradoxus]MDR6521230.1 uncharacterized membrane protein YoaK (UPF0700 family) [Variovorax paradoxus]
MATKYVLAALAAVFLVAVGVRLARGGANDPATRTWLLVAAIFTAIAAWLQWHTS